MTHDDKFAHLPKDDIKAVHDALHDYMARLAAQPKETTEPSELTAASLESYSEEDRAFFKFWYSHMSGDVISGPVCGTSFSVARYIWDAARASHPAPAQTGEKK